MKIIESLADFDGEDESTDRLLSRIPSVRQLQEWQRIEVEKERDLFLRLQEYLDTDQEAGRTGIPRIDPQQLEKQLAEQMSAVGAQLSSLQESLRGFQHFQGQHDIMVRMGIPMSSVSSQEWEDRFEYLRRLQSQLAQRMIALCQNYLDQKARNEEAGSTDRLIPLRSTSTADHLPPDSSRTQRFRFLRRFH